MSLIELNMVIDHDAHVEQTQPVVIDTSKVRAFCSRKYGKVGTRLVYDNGAAEIVADAYDVVKSIWPQQIAPAPDLPERQPSNGLRSIAGDLDELN